VSTGAEEREAFRTLPINLLLKGRLCLLAGAGHVADRKCRSLLSHGARVVLVAPEAGEGVRDLEAAGDVVVRREGYETRLLTELRPFLVYAATDDDDLNARIVRDAAALGILASSVSCWREGDFISPSQIPWGRGQVSVSTEGASCRQAKFMRMRLSELLGGEREFLLVGVDLRSVTLSEFERVRPDAARARVVAGMLMHLAALEEFALLATCNRLELYAWARRDEGLLSAVLRLLDLESLADRAYVKSGGEVVEHAANVVAGSFSEVMGETQIVGQFKAAFAEAFERNAAGVHLQILHDRALATGRKIRAAAGTGEEGLPEIVADVLRRRFPSRAKVLVVGAGPLGREVAARVAELPGVRLSWANRSLARIPDAPPAEKLPLDDALADLSRFDAAICVAGAREPLVLARHLPENEPAPLLVDLGLPRNVAPELAARPDITVLGLPDFRRPGRDREARTALARTLLAGSGVVRD
jgi:glutamyl-tRNA reductase